MLRALAGYLAVAALKILGSFPPRFIVLLGTPWIPFYALIRPNLRRRLRYLKGHVSFPTPTPLAYYRMRLRLAALSLRHLTGHYQDSMIQVEGEEHYQAACASGKSVVILGWHQGPVELLHRIPSAPSNGRPFYIATIGGFTSPLSRFLKEGRKQKDKQVLDSKSLPSALRSWARQCGILAVMIDQVPGCPKDWLSLWSGTIEIPFPSNLWDWLKSRDTVFIAVSVRIGNDGVTIVQYDPIKSDVTNFGKLLEQKLANAADQYNWSYPKIRYNFSG